MMFDTTDQKGSERMFHKIGHWIIWGMLLWWGGVAVHAGEFEAVEHQRARIYHSPQSPGFTCWCGAWLMPDGGLMVSFTQATGPVEGRKSAPPEIQKRLGWPPPGRPAYDMTGLDLRNVHLRSADAGRNWKQVSADPFQTCMNGVTGEAETALADGTILRAVFGYYLPYNPELPQTAFLQRSTDGSATWSKPEVPLDATRYLTWPRRIRTLRDGRLLLLTGVVPIQPGVEPQREEFARQIVPMLVMSADQGKTWKGPLPVVPDDQHDGWTEEFDVAELATGDLFCVFRRAADAHRWQSQLKKSNEGWIPGRASAATLPHSGQPELLATREGPILHLATSGIHATTDAGATWRPLKIPGTTYYPRSLQTATGRIHVFGHIGSDDPYGGVDQAIVMDSFRLESRN
jgi:hypothetical protein